MEAYYERRAPEYDEWYRGVGRYAERDRPGWDEEVDALTRALAEELGGGEKLFAGRWFVADRS